MTIRGRIELLQIAVNAINDELEPIFLKKDEASLAKKEELRTKVDELKAEIAALEKLAKDLVDNKQLEDPEFVSKMIAGYIENCEARKEENKVSVEKLSFLAPYVHQFKFLRELCGKDCLCNNPPISNDGSMSDQEIQKRLDKIAELFEYAERFFPKEYLNSELLGGWTVIKYIESIKEQQNSTKKRYGFSKDGIEEFNKMFLDLRKRFILDFLGRFPDGFVKQLDPERSSRESLAYEIVFSALDSHNGSYGRLSFTKEGYVTWKDEYFKYNSTIDGLLTEFKTYFDSYVNFSDKISELDSEIARLQSLSPEEKKAEVRKRTESFEFPKLVKPIGNSTAETVKYFGAKLKELQALKGNYHDIMDMPECKALRNFQIPRKKVYSDAELKELYDYDYFQYGVEVAELALAKLEDDEHKKFLADCDVQDLQHLISYNSADLKTTDVNAFRKKFLGIVERARKKAADEIAELTSQKQNDESEVEKIKNSREQELYRKVDGPNGEKRYAKFKLLFKIFNRKKYNENKTEIDGKITKLTAAAKNAGDKIRELENLNTTRKSISSKINGAFDGPGCSKIAELGEKFELYLAVSNFYDTQEKRDNISRMWELHKEKEKLEGELIKELDAKIAECQNTGKDDLLEELQYIRNNVTSLNSGDLSENMQATLAARETAYTSLSERYGKQTAEELVSGDIEEADAALGIKR